MKLLKFCRREHHISTATTIRVGTLDFYRNHDSKFIADPREGTSTHIVSGDESILIPQGELEQIFSGSNIQFQGGGMFLAPGSHFHFAHGVPNCPIFCCSAVEELTLEMAASFGYDSYYEIADIDTFVQLVGKGFLHNCMTEITSKGLTGITPIRGRVRYQETRSHNHTRAPRQLRLFKLSLFTKTRVSEAHPDVKFEENAEYRIAWMVTQGNDWISVDERPMDVPVTEELRATCRW